MQTYRSGKISKARPTIDRVVQSLSDPNDVLYAAREVQDMCFSAWDPPCVDEYQAKILEAVTAIQANPKTDAKERLAGAIEVLERHTRKMLLMQRWDEAIEFAKPLMDDRFAPHQVHDFVQLNITFAHVALVMEDREKARHFLDRAWMRFLASRNMAPQQFMRRMPEFVFLMRRVGRAQRAAHIAAIAEDPIRSSSASYRYDTLRFLSYYHDVLADQNNIEGAVSAVAYLQDILKEVDINERFRLWLRSATTASLVIDCFLQKTTKCPTEDTVQALEAEIPSDLANLQPWEIALFRSICLAIVLRASETGTPVSPAVAKFIENDSVANFPHSHETGTTVAAQLAVAKFFLRMSRGEKSDEDLLTAARSELSRSDEFVAHDPFNVSSLSGYTRAIFMFAAKVLSEKERLSPEEVNLLLRMSLYLNRSPRSLQSQFLFLLSKAPDDSIRASLQALQLIENNLAAFERKALQDLIAALLSRRPGKPSGDFVARIWTSHVELAELRDSHRQARSWAGSELRKQSNLLEQIQRPLLANERYIATFEAAGAVVRVCIARKDYLVGRTTTDDSKESTHILALSKSLVGQEVLSGRSDDFPFDSAKRIGEIVLGQDGSCLEQASHVLISVPPPLLALPMGVLPDPGELKTLSAASSKNYRTFPWLGARRAVSTVLDIREFIASRSLQKMRRHEFEFLGVGDPRLKGNTRDGEPRMMVAMRGVVRGGTSTSLALLEELPDTATELTNMAQVFGQSSQLLVGDLSTEIQVRRRLLSNYRVISFATHGLVREEIPGVLEPALVLTPVDSKSQINDGLLSASEISQLRLTADLVILSACNTAKFDLDMFGAQAAALSGAFFQAGARSVIASLWNVNSESTARLMEAFAQSYVDKLGLGAAHALQNATKAILSNSSNDLLAHPRFWAAFSVYGDGGERTSNAVITDPSFRLRPSRDWRPSLGELPQLSGTDRPIAAGFIHTTPRVTGSIHRLSNDGKELWRIEDSGRGFVVANKPEADGGVVALAWSWNEQRPSSLNFRRYNNEGALLADVPLDAYVQEIPASLIRYSDGTYILATTGEVVDTVQGVVLRRIAANGTVLTKRAIPKNSRIQFAYPRLIDTKSGILLVTSGSDSSLSSDLTTTNYGSAKVCFERKLSEVRWIREDLQDRGAPELLNNIEVRDYAVTDGGSEAFAVSLTNECDLNWNATAVVSRRPDRSPEIGILELAGHSLRPNRIRPHNGQFVIAGSTRRIVDFYRSNEGVDTDMLTAERLVRNATSTRQSGGFLGLVDGMTVESLEFVFAGADLYLSDLTKSDGNWFLAGSVGAEQFIGEFDPPTSGVGAKFSLRAVSIPRLAQALYPTQ